MYSIARSLICIDSSKVKLQGFFCIVTERKDKVLGSNDFSLFFSKTTYRIFWQLYSSISTSLLWVWQQWTLNYHYLSENSPQEVEQRGQKGIWWDLKGGKNNNLKERRQLRHSRVKEEESRSLREVHFLEVKKILRTNTTSNQVEKRGDKKKFKLKWKYWLWHCRLTKKL